jgi:hypothetical protein
MFKGEKSANSLDVSNWSLWNFPVNSPYLEENGETGSARLTPPPVGIKLPLKMKYLYFLTDPQTARRLKAGYGREMLSGTT